MKLKKEFKLNVKKAKTKEFNNNKLKQAIITLHNDDADIKTVSKAQRKVRWHMIWQNVFYLLKLIALSAFSLFLGIQPFIMAGEYAHNALTLPYKHITNGQIMQIQFTVYGQYMMGAAVFAAVLLWVLNRPWTKIPYHRTAIEEYVEKHYPQIKSEADKLSKK